MRPALAAAGSPPDGSSERRGTVDGMIAGDRVGPYVLRDQLEAGGCHPRYLADGPEGTVVIDLFPILDPSPAGQRFEREMGIVLKILRDAANPVIRPLHAIGTHDGCEWIATAPAGGEALQVWLEQPRAWPEAEPAGPESSSRSRGNCWPEAATRDGGRMRARRWWRLANTPK